MWSFSYGDEESGWYSSSDCGDDDSDAEDENEDNISDDYESDVEEGKDGYKFNNWDEHKSDENDNDNSVRPDDNGNGESKLSFVNTSAQNITDGSPMMPTTTSDWVERFSESKRLPYWKNTRTQESTWNNPHVKSTKVLNRSQSEKYAPTVNKRNMSRGTSFDPSAISSTKLSTFPSAAESDTGEWVERFSESKQIPYWKNTRTQQSTWKNPHLVPKHSFNRSQSGHSHSPSMVERVQSVDDIGGPTPSDWVEKFSDRKQKKYWKNIRTNHTTWNNPLERTGQGEKVDASQSQRKLTTQPSISPSPKAEDNSHDHYINNWEEKFSQSKQKPYWKNKVTLETSWKPPLKPLSSPSKSGGGFLSSSSDTPKLPTPRSLSLERSQSASDGPKRAHLLRHSKSSDAKQNVGARDISDDKL